MKNSRLRVPSVMACLTLVSALGCGSVAGGTDGGQDATAGQAGAAGGSGGKGGDGGAGSTGSAGQGGAGSTGNAGHDGGAGSTGSAGHDGGADGGASCSDLETQFSKALTEAQSCKVGAAGQCEQAVSSSLSPCFSNCMTYVNDASTLNALKAQWLAAGCANQRAIPCPAIACLKPTPGNCVAKSGGGMCSSTLLTTN